MPEANKEQSFENHEWQNIKCHSINIEMYALELQERDWRYICFQFIHAFPYKNDTNMSAFRDIFQWSFPSQYSRVEVWTISSNSEASISEMFHL